MLFNALLFVCLSGIHSDFGTLHFLMLSIVREQKDRRQLSEFDKLFISSFLLNECKKKNKHCRPQTGAIAG